MLLHMLNHSMNIFIIARMTKLIQFIVSDCLYLHLFSNSNQILC